MPKKAISNLALHKHSDLIFYCSSNCSLCSSYTDLFIILNCAGTHLPQGLCFVFLLSGTSPRYLSNLQSYSRSSLKDPFSVRRSISVYNWITTLLHTIPLSCSSLALCNLKHYTYISYPISYCPPPHF